MAVPPPPRRLHPGALVVLGISTAAATLAAAPARTKPADKQLLTAMDGLVRQVSRLRGIPVRRKISRAVIDRQEARARLESMAQSTRPPERVAAEGRMLERMGLTAPGSDYSDLVAKMVARQVGGFYDPKERTIFLADWIPLDQQRATMLHEIAHALQDQRFDLKSMLAPLPGESDRSLARKAVVEGEATAVMIEAMDADGELGSPREIDRLARQALLAPPGEIQRAPAYLRELMLFPYVEGLSFVARLRGRHPWSMANILWKRPPDSTEQVLHPEKYGRRELPVSVVASTLPALARTHRLAATDSLGEAVIRVWLTRGGSRPRAERAAAGWGGDRIAVHLPRDETAAAPEAVLAWLTVWDSEADAVDFAQAARVVLAGLAGVPPTRSGDSFTDRHGALFAFERKGRLVALLLGVPASSGAVASDVLGWRTVTKPAARQ